MLVLPVTAAQCERVFSAQTRVKTDCRSSLATETLEDLIRISSEGSPVCQFQPEAVAAKWMNSSTRSRRLAYKGWPGEVS